MATVSVNAWVLFGLIPFEATMHTVYVPTAWMSGAPDRRPLLERVTPEGKVDGVQSPNAEFENVGAGLPDAVTWKLSAVPTKKLVELALVTAGALVVEGAWPDVPEEAGAWPVVAENGASGALTQSVLMS